MEVILHDLIEEEFKEFILEILEDYFPNWSYEESSIENMEFSPYQGVRMLILETDGSDKDIYRLLGVKQMFYSDIEYFVLISDSIQENINIQDMQDKSLRLISKEEEAFEDLFERLQNDGEKDELDLPIELVGTLVQNGSDSTNDDQKEDVFLINNSPISREITNIEGIETIANNVCEQGESVEFRVEVIDSSGNKESVQEDLFLNKVNHQGGTENQKDAYTSNQEASVEKLDLDSEVEKKDGEYEKLEVTFNGEEIDSNKIKQINAERKEYENRLYSLREYIDIPIYKKKTIPHKAIGLWSPLSRSGVTTMTVNLALYLSEYAFPIAVLEAFTTSRKLKSVISTFSDGPNEWKSFSKYLKEGGLPEQILWDVKGAHFYPFATDDDNDEFLLNEELVEYFVEGLKFYDLLLVDLPTGKMEPYTKNVIKYLDELWIIVNNDILSVMEWKYYIENVLKPEINCKLIFNEHLQFSKPELIEKELGLSNIVNIPSMHIEINKNHYKTLPLLEQDYVYNKLEPSFIKLLEHVAGDQRKIKQFKVKENKKNIQDYLKKFLQYRK